MLLKITIKQSMLHNKFMMSSAKYYSDGGPRYRFSGFEKTYSLLEIRRILSMDCDTYHQSRLVRLNSKLCSFGGESRCQFL